MLCTSENAGQFVRKNGWYLKGRNIKDRKGLSVDECQNWCAEYAGCQSFDYAKGKQKCFLHKVTSADKGVKMKAGKDQIYGELCPGMKLMSKAARKYTRQDYSVLIQE